MSKTMRAQSNNKQNNELFFRKRWTDNAYIKFLDIGIINNEKEKILEINEKDKLNIFLDFIVNDHCKSIYFVFSILNESKNIDCVFIKSNDNKKYSFQDIRPGKYRIIASLPEHHLGVGVYFLNYAIGNDITGEIYDHGLTEYSFVIKSDIHYERGIILAEDYWTLTKQE